MHWEYVSKLQLLYPVDEHHGYCPNLWAAAGMAALVTEITVAKISRKCFIGDTIVEEPSSATAYLLHGSGHRPWRSLGRIQRNEPLGVPDGSFASGRNQTARKFSAEDLPFFGLATTSKATL
jgi:hypothetical protein